MSKIILVVLNKVHSHYQNDQTCQMVEFSLYQSAEVSPICHNPTDPIIFIICHGCSRCEYLTVKSTRSMKLVLNI